MSDQATLNITIGTFTQLITLSLVILKLRGIIDWSWWTVTVFLWGPLALAGILVSGMFIAWLLFYRGRNG